MTHGGSMLSLTAATTAKNQQSGAWPATSATAALWSNR